MGKRRGRTGPGGAVVSSLSQNAGGTIRQNRRTEDQNTNSRSKGRRREEDPELAELANPTKGKGKKPGAAGSSSASSESNPSASLSLPSAAPKWLGKSPKQMLREWCTKNNRIRPYFSKMAGDEGIMRCTIPAGRKDGKKVKGSAFDRIVGVGDLPGEEYAALNVLHQVERGKPLERLLGPEYRNVWLDLDKRFEEVQSEEKQRAELKEKRKAQAERRAKIEKSKESATINISTTSRQLIEDALLEHKASSAGSSKNHDPPPTISGVQDVSGMREQHELKNELIRMGFAEFDALDASGRFSNVTDAVDYLCLNLDEAELPPSFSPTSDVEVVQFYSGSGKQPRVRVDQTSRDFLVNKLCLSKHAAEKALRKADGELDVALGLLFNTLTHDLLADQGSVTSHNDTLRIAGEERATETETISAIYGEDATVGVGAVPEIGNRWAAVITIREGLAALNIKGPITVAFIDVDGFYPFSSPVITVFSSVAHSQGKREVISASQRRMLMRAAACEVLSLRRSFIEDESTSQDRRIPVPVIHGVLSFLADVSKNSLLSSLAIKNQSAARAVKAGRSDGSETKMESTGMLEKGVPTKTARQRLVKPLPVHPLRSSPELHAMQKRRSELPAHNARAEILAKVKSNQVVVVSGATGSGKTTQVPQFLLEEAASTLEPISIVCTQPRRIAAMSVAERVATERCQKVGESVGYQVKLNAKRSQSTRLLFCTTGVLLRRLQGDRNLDGLTHVLVDEVHERSVETDFLLLLLREIAARRPSLKVVLMSATLDAQKFSSYFSSALSVGRKQVDVPIVTIPGRTFPVTELYLEDAVRIAQYRLRAGERFAKRTGKAAHKGKYGPEPPEGSTLPPLRNSASAMVASDELALDDEREYAAETEGAKSVHSSGSWNPGRDSSVQSPLTNTGAVRGQEDIEYKQTVSLIDEALVNVDLIERLVKKIDDAGRRRGEHGAILIFLPGAADISGVIKKLMSGSGAHSLWALPLHSLLSPDEQNKVFSRAPKGKRKVICATNIAETSITVDDVTVVIDTLRAKEMGYDALNRSSVLEECFISKAAAKQRAGRAGRVSEGMCYRLVRKHTFENRIAAQQTPEIQRVALEHLILHMLSIIPDEESQNDPHAFLGKAIDPPEAQSISTAISSLIDIGALQRIEDSTKVSLTALGKHLTGLPVDARIGKLLIFGSLFSCVDAALTIAATISERSPFYAPFDKREEARAARQPFVWGKSDLLTYVKAFNAWRDISRSGQDFGAESDFCNQNFMSRKTLLSIRDARKQLADALSDAGFGLPGMTKSHRGWETDASVNEYSGNVRVLKAVVCAALYPNITRIDLPDTTYHEVAAGTVANKYNAKDLRLRARNGDRMERVFLHPESVNFHQGNYETRWLAYYAKVKTSKLFVRDSTMVSPYAILLFGGDIAIQHERGQMSVDKWIIFKAPARVAVLARELRRQLDSLLLSKFDSPDIDLQVEGKAINDAIIRLITAES